MNKYDYQGPFKNHILDFIELKQAIGYKYISEACNLKRFDTFTLQKYADANSLSKEIIMDWCTKRSYEKQENLCGRASIIRQFAIYLDDNGISAYIIPKNYFKSGEQYVPHIYTNEELMNFFKETDKCHYCYECPLRHLIMPIFFRMIYTCGLRVSEARLIKVEDVDLTHGLLSIQHSKKDNSRLVPMANELTERCHKYFDQVHCNSDKERYFFPGMEERPMTLSNVYHNFRRFLWKAGISHGGRGYGPRIHDFRYPNLYKIQTLI
jgi:integrase